MVLDSVSSRCSRTLVLSFFCKTTVCHSSSSILQRCHSSFSKCKADKEKETKRIMEKHDGMSTKDHLHTHRPIWPVNRCCLLLARSYVGAFSTTVLSESHPIYQYMFHFHVCLFSVVCMYMQHFRFSVQVVLSRPRFFAVRVRTRSLLAITY